MPGELKEVVEKRSSVLAGDPVPCWNSTTSIRGKGGYDETRLTALRIHFTNHFGQQPSFFIRVPGRVNLIGEHVDYCGYGVFPMAIEQDVLIACHPLEADEDEQNSPTLRLINLSSEYGEFQCQLKDMKELLSTRKSGVAPPWHLYYFCGVLGIVEEYLGTSVPVSMNICVDGRVPPRAGLSSSSALVCAAALSTLVANKGEMDRKALASLCAKSERYIGTQGGGMDQAIAFLANAGTAQHIEFIPELRGDKVSLPSSAVFVIANSLVEANKAASDGYNVRVAECRLSTWILAKIVGLPNFLQFEKIKQLQLALGFNFQEMLDLVDANIHQEPYNALEVSEILGVHISELEGKPLMNRIPLKSLPLKLYQRVTHVLREASRVEEFHKVCGQSGKDALIRMGKLMNQSHQSLRDSYECSHPRLDTLVALAQGVTYGARLTGAGWGGCMVALADADQLPLLLETLKRDYYHGIGVDDITSHVFVTQPGSGASILRL